MLAESLKKQMKMLCVVFPSLWIHKYVVNEHNHEPIEKWTKDCIHKIHEGWRHVRKPKKHNQKLEVTISCVESFLQNILFPNFELVISSPQIYFREVPLAS
jgi:hypothetical protein